MCAFVTHASLAGSLSLSPKTCTCRAQPVGNFDSSFISKTTAKRRWTRCYTTERKGARVTKSVVAETEAVIAAGGASASLLLAQNSPALQAAIAFTGPFLNIFNFVMVVRIILTWYPQTNLTKSPWIFLAVPTEPLLAAMRKVAPPVGGVDISPIVWFALGSFIHEILVGPQGLLILLAAK